MLHQPLFTRCATVELCECCPERGFWDEVVMTSEALMRKRAKLNQILMDNPPEAEVLFERALINAQLRRRGSAVRDMARALALNADLIEQAKAQFALYADDPFIVEILAPQSPMSKVIRLLHSGKFQSAHRQLTSLLTAEPGNPSLLFLASLIAAALDEYEDAASFAARCIAVDPNFTDAHFNLAFAHEALLHHEQAISSYRTALTLENDHESSAFNLILLLRRLDRHAEAAAIGVKALAAQPMALMVRYKHAETLAILGRPDDALRELEKIVERDPAASKSVADNEHFAPYLEIQDWQLLIECDHIF
jgi:tetratricopeptide (TPR) repeat protein